MPVELTDDDSEVFERIIAAGEEAKAWLREWLASPERLEEKQALEQLAAQFAAELGELPAGCRACPQCGASLAGKRPDVVYCSGACRQRAYRRRRKQRSASSRGGA